MKQLLQNLRTGEVTVTEVPAPTPQPGEVLVKNASSLVSAGTERMVVEFAEKSLVGKARSRPDLVRQVLDKARREGWLSTLEATFNRLDQPMVMGYSSAGTVVALGEGVQGFRAGQRVACGGGGFAVHAEIAAVPRNLVVPLPDGVDFESAAFTTLGAVAMHGFRLAEAQLGERVAVIGLGLLGLLAVGIAQAAGCKVLGVDLDPQRVALAQSLGATAVLRPDAKEAASSFSRGRGCDAILICADSSSADPIELAGEIARDRARVIAVGAVKLQIPRKVYYEKELTFLSSRSYGPGRYDPSYEEGGKDYPIGYVRWTEGRNLEAFVDLLDNRRLDVRPLITHRFPLEAAPQAYELITARRSEPFLGVLLTYPEQEERNETTQATDKAKDGRDGSAPAVQTPLILTPDQVVDQVRLGVLGAGNFATAVMLPAVRKVKGIELAGIASASGVSAQSAAARFGFRFASGDENKILDDPAINTVAILTRHNLHARQILAALAAGKHVFCEKPLALNEPELEEIQAALLASPGLQLMVGFNRRFAPLARRMFTFLEGRQEPLFAYYRVNAGYLPLNHWTHDLTQGGGRIVGEGCHFVDFLSFLAGAPPVSVSAKGLPDAGRYAEDNVTLTLTFPDGSIGTLAYLANGDKSFPKERVEVFCAGRAAALNDFRSLEMATGGRREVLHSRMRQDKGHQAEWEAFARSLREGGSPPIPYNHLFGVTRTTFAALQALRAGEIIYLPIEPEWTGR